MSGSADRKIQNDRQRKQIPRFGKYYAIQSDVRAALCQNVQAGRST